MAWPFGLCHPAFPKSMGRIGIIDEDAMADLEASGAGAGAGSSVPVDTSRSISRVHLFQAGALSSSARAAIPSPSINIKRAE